MMSLDAKKIEWLDFNLLFSRNLLCYKFGLFDDIEY